MLLLFLLGAGGDASKYGTGLDDDAGRGWFGRQGVGWTDGDGDTEGALGLAFINAAGRRDVGVVAANGDADVAITADEVVGGIEGGPTEARDKGFDPGVGSAFEGAVFVAVFLAMKEVAADVTAGDAERAHEGNHDVGEILADSLAGLQRVFDGGIDFGAVGHVVEEGVDAFVEMREQFEGSAAAFALQFLR